MTEVPPKWERFIAASERVGRVAVTEFERVWPTAHPDLYRPAVHEVLTGMVAHQVYLLAVIAVDPNLWHSTLGGMVVRAMTETLVNIRWIAAGGDERARRFQEYSLGRRKLLALHIERLVDEGALRKGWEQQAEELRAVVDGGKWGEVLDIELGSWNDQNIRETAMQVGMKFEYDLIHAPASAAVHVEWSHLQATVLQRCREVLHRGHWIPRRVGDNAAHPVVASQAAHLTQKSIDVWSSTLKGEHADLEPAVKDLDAIGQELARDFFGWPAAPQDEAPA